MHIPDSPSRAVPAPEAHADHRWGDSRQHDLIEQAATDARDWIQSLDEATRRSLGYAPDPVRRIAAAVIALDGARVVLGDRVAEARARGHTWAHIAAALGTTRDAAVARYGSPPPPAPPVRPDPGGPEAGEGPNCAVRNGARIIA